MSRNDDDSCVDRKSDQSRATSSSAASIHEDLSPIGSDPGTDYDGEALSSLSKAGTDSSHPAPAINDEFHAEFNEGNGAVVQGSPTGEPDPLAAAAAVVALVLGSAYPSMHNNSPFTNNCGVPSEVGAQISTTQGIASISLPSSHAHYDPHTHYNPHGHPLHHSRAAVPHAVDLQQPAQADDDDDFLVDGHFEKRRLTPTEEQTANDICGTPYTLERGITLPLRVQADYADQEMWEAAGLDTTGTVLGARESDTDSPYSSQASRGSAADVPLNVEAVALPQVSEVQSASVYTSLSSSRMSSTGVTQDLTAFHPGPSAEVVPSPKDGDERDPSSHTPDVAGGLANFPVVPEEDGGESEPLIHVLVSAPSDFESEPVTASTSAQALVETNEPSFTHSPLGDDYADPQERGDLAAAYPPSYSPGGPGDTIVFEPSNTAQVIPASSSQSMTASQEMAPLMRTRSRKRARDIDENSSSPVRVPETKSPLPSSRRPRKLQRTSSRPFSQKQVENRESQSSLFGRNTPSQELSFD